VKIITGAEARRCRQKGVEGERELALKLQGHLGVKLKRRLDQYQQKGHDLAVPVEARGPVADELRRYSFEVKRAATPQINSWWRQAERQAGDERVPLLAYRIDRFKWRIRLPLSELVETIPRWPGSEHTVEMGLAAFAAVVRERANARAG